MGLRLRLGHVAMLASAGWAAWRYYDAQKRRWPSFRGRVVLVTGGSRGLGFEIARQLAGQGARVAICARNADDLEKAASMINAPKSRLVGIACDVTRPVEVKELIAKIQRRFGRLDVVINNAGVIRVGPIESMGVKDFEQAMDTHFWAPVHTTLAAVPVMKRQGEGRIVNISSIGGKISPPHLIPYNASKFALVGLSTGLRAELAKDNIWVTTVCPGLMRTGSALNADFKGRSDAEFRWFGASTLIPGLTIGVSAAARRILRACLAGEGEVVLSVPAQVGARFNGLFPNLVTDLFRIAVPLLPGVSGSRRITKGRDTQGRVNRLVRGGAERIGRSLNESPSTGPS